MEANSSLTPLLLADTRPHRARLAWWVTQLGSPPVLGLVGAIALGQAVNTPAGWQQLGIYVALTWLLPLAYIVWLLRRGEVSDFNMQARAERLKPMRMSLATAILGWLILTFMAAPPLLLALAAANLAQSSLYLFITMRWKISIHAAIAAALATLTWHIWGAVALPMTAVVPLIAWSRVCLRRHTVAQTIAGMAVGTCVLALALAWYGA